MAIIYEIKKNCDTIQSDNYMQHLHGFRNLIILMFQVNQVLLRVYGHTSRFSVVYTN